jgi:hypothetical protein
MQVHSYRLYVYREDGALIGPAMAIDANDDDAAIGEAAKRVDGFDAELRDELRLVKAFSRPHKPA